MSNQLEIILDNIKDYISDNNPKYLYNKKFIPVKVRYFIQDLIGTTKKY